MSSHAAGHGVSWTTHQIHYGEYTGPTYSKELDAAHPAYMAS
jgi:hypothetical protein